MSINCISILHFSFPSSSVIISSTPNLSSFNSLLNIGFLSNDIFSIFLFNIKGLEEVEYHSTWKIIETNSAKKLILTDKFELDIIELSKIKGRENEKDQLLDWLIFLENPESERVTRKMEENENLKEAVEKLDRISKDEKMQRIIELREKAIRDEHAIYAKGVDDGIEEGKAKGAREKQIEIAKSMLKENMDIEMIIKITGLTKQEIEKLQEM